MLNPFRKSRPRGWRLKLVSPLFLVALWGLTSGAVVAQAGQNATQIGQRADQILTPKELDVLDTQFQEFLDQFLQRYVKKTPPSPEAGMESLIARVRTAGTVEALAVVRANLDLIRKSTSAKEFDTLLDYLYHANDTATIQILTEHLKSARKSVASSRNYLLLARYYEQRHNWPAVQGALSRIDVKSLSQGDKHYYQLLMGYALQNLKEHRKSLQYYQQIPPSSPYFAHAKLNEGTANLRQGWWTEAHIEFERAIQFLTDNSRDPDLRNRLLVVLGYSQLHYEFYRDARNSLRKVAVDSSSANKALMGIGLAAAYQKDFVGAANAFRLLTEKPVADLSVDEAFLLLPYALEETGNKDSAGAAYQNAVAHYQQKLDELLNLENRILGIGDGQLLEAIQGAEARAAEIYGGAAGIPDYLQRNFENLMQMQALAGEPGLEKTAQELRQRYQQYLRNAAAHNIEARRATLNSYLSQAKFGMAKLYDAP